MKVIMRRACQILSLSTFALGFASLSPAMAQTAEIVPLPTVSFIGSGCSDAEQQANYHWEASTLVVNFGGMVAQKGSGISLTQSRKTCSITINLKLPKGLSYSLGGYAASGFDDLADKDTRAVSVTNFFQGQGQTTTLNDDSLGPVGDDFSITHYNAAGDYLWSPCNAERAQTVTAAIRIGNGGDRAAPSTATLDSLRLPIRIKLCAKIFN